MTDRDRLLLANFRSGDEEAFVELYRAHAPMLYLFARRLLSNDATAEDVLQEMWIRAVRAKFDGRSAVRTWLIGILLNCCREQRRRSAGGPDADPAVAGGISPEAGIDLERAVRALPQGYREVFLLHDVYGYTHEEIAALSSIDASTSRSQLSRARERVRMYMKGTENGRLDT